MTKKRFKTRTGMATGLIKKAFGDAWNGRNGLGSRHLIVSPLIPFIVGGYALFKSYDPKIRDEKTGEYIVKNY